MIKPALEPHILAGEPLNSPRRLEYLRLLASDDALLRAEIVQCASDPWWFKTGWCFSLDEQANPTRRPWPEHEYLRVSTRAWLAEPMLLEPKSRQMMISWDKVGDLLWEAMFHHGKRLPIHTKKKEDADYQVKRAWLLWEMLPQFLKKLSPANPQKRGACIEGKLSFPSRNSEILALPEGSEHVRSSSPSRLWEDEFQLQPDAEEILQGAMPALGLGKWAGTGTGGFLCMTGTAKPGKMAEIYKDQAEMLPAPGIGMRAWYTSNGCYVLEIHYSADPGKRRGTPEGDAWYEAERRAWFAAGGTEEGWQREYEINFDVCGGVRFYPEVSRELHWRSEFAAWPDRPFLCGWDFGFHFPAFIIGQLDDNDVLVEFAVRRVEDVDFDVFCPRVLQWRIGLFGPDARFYDFIDPQGNAKTDLGETNVQRMKRLGRAAGVEVTPRWRDIGREEGNTTVRRLLLPRRDGRPGLMFAGQAFEGFHALQNLVVDEKKDEPERAHPWIDIFDALKYQACGMVGKADKPGVQYSAQTRAEAEDRMADEMTRREQYRERARA